MSFPVLGRHSPRLKALRRLDTPAGRAEAGAFLVEGPRVLREAMSAGVPLQLLLVAHPPSEEALALGTELLRRGVEVCSLEASVLERLSPAKTSQGFLAVAALPLVGLEAVLASDLVLVLEGIQDPGNLGTLLRSALGAGAGGALLMGGADPLGPRAVRSSAGAVFRLPALRLLPEEALAVLAGSGHALVAAEAHGGADLFEATLPRRMALVLGAEVQGVSSRVRRAAAFRVTIPLATGCESLNVASAGALVLFEHRRRHRAGVPVAPSG